MGAGKSLNGPQGFEAVLKRFQRVSAGGCVPLEKKTKVFWHQSEARAAPTVWNWSVKTLSPGALSLVLIFSLPEFFLARLDFLPAPTNCPWVSEDALYHAICGCGIFCVSFRQEMHLGLQQKEANQEMMWKLT